MKIHHFAVVTSVIAAAVVSSVWYSSFLFGEQWRELREPSPGAMPDMDMPAWKMFVEIVREFVVAHVLARLVVRIGVADWREALGLGFSMWIGFPVAMLVGASLWDDKPWMLTLIHAGDWLVKMLLMSVILSLWRRQDPAGEGCRVLPRGIHPSPR